MALDLPKDRAFIAYVEDGPLMLKWAKGREVFETVNYICCCCNRYGCSYSDEQILGWTDIPRLGDQK